MYTNPKNGPTAAATAAPTLHVGTYRRALLALVVGNPLFTDAEQLLSSHNAHDCQDGRKLALWLKNTRRVAAEREKANGLASLGAAIDRFEQHLASKQVPVPTAEQPTTTAPAPWATPTQCDEVFRLASALPQRERADALRRLPTLTEAEARACIAGLQLRRGPRYRVEVGKVQYTVAERHYEGAKVDYVRETGTGKVRPLYETRYGGPLVRRVWAN